MVKSLLINAGIQAYLKDEIIGSIMPWGGTGSVMVTVSEEDLEEARLVVTEYEKNKNI